MGENSKKRNIPLAQRIIEKIEDRGDGCWHWIGYRNPQGYGRVRLAGRKGKLLLAHRASYQCFVGEIPEGNLVRHSCDNPSCVNPDHLSLGTQVDNMNDMMSRGRKPLKISDEQVAQIIAMRQEKVPYKTIAAKYNCSVSHLSDIVHGRRRQGFDS